MNPMKPIYNLEDSNTLFEEIADAYPDMTNTKIRNTLAAFSLPEMMFSNL